MKVIVKYLFFLTLLSVYPSCTADKKNELNPSFEIEELEGNYVRFLNTSKGDDGNLWIIDGVKYYNKDEIVKYFPGKGSYTAKLSVYQGAEKKTISKTFSLKNNDVVASFDVVDTDKDNTWLIQNKIEGKYDSIFWDFGYGETSREANPGEVHYQYKGRYIISLKLYKNGYELGAEEPVTVLSDDSFNKEQLIWSDEFDGSSLNLNNWTYDVGDHGWGNQELQNYTGGDNAEIREGKFIITARKINESQQSGSYTSTRIITQDKQSFLYGRIEARIKLPSGKGTWPAFWMLGENISTVGWPKCGEIDIMEHVGYDPDTHHSAVHNEDSYGNTAFKGDKYVSGIENDFHTYGIIWTPQEIRFYMDDPAQVHYRYKPIAYNEKTWPFDKEQFILLNLAIGGTWGGVEGIDNSIFPQEYIIDYVRVYK